MWSPVPSCPKARKARQVTLAATFTPGSVLVTDASKPGPLFLLSSKPWTLPPMAWHSNILPQLLPPMHFLAEPESATRTTAEAAGGPTFRRFEQRQQFFSWLLYDLLSVVISRRAQVDYAVSPTPELQIVGADISARDNVSHSISTVNILNAFERLYDMGLISRRELLRITDRFAGESGDIDEILAQGTKDTRCPASSTTPSSKL